nr:ribonuclease H-like domain-containing protein [Tanacetum cinerariifolium]
GHPKQVKEDQGYVDSGCSRHMTRNMSYLLNFKEFNRGYVTFGGGENGGKISSKGSIHTCNLDFEDVYFVKELKIPRRNNMYSVDMKNSVPKERLTCLIYDKKNNVLFTDTECLVLSPNFKLPDDNQILLRVPRRNNMRNWTLIEAARTMLADSKLPTTLWAEAVNTACHVQNRALVVKPHNKTLYELFRGRTPALSFMKPFGCHVTILNTLGHLGKFDGKAMKVILLDIL